MDDNISGDVKGDMVQVDPPDCPIFKGAVMCLIIILRIFILSQFKNSCSFLNYRNAFVLYDDCPLDLNKSL